MWPVVAAPVVHMCNYRRGVAIVRIYQYPDLSVVTGAGGGGS